MPSSVRRRFGSETYQHAADSRMILVQVVIGDARRGFCLDGRFHRADDHR